MTKCFDYLECGDPERCGREGRCRQHAADEGHPAPPQQQPLVPKPPSLWRRLVDVARQRDREDSRC